MTGTTIARDLLIIIIFSILTSFIVTKDNILLIMFFILAVIYVTVYILGRICELNEVRK